MKNLLIVDDSYTIRKVIEMLLAPQGYTIYFAENAAKAREHLQSQNIEGVLLDHGLPDAESVAFSKEIKAAYPGIALMIMVSAKEEVPVTVLKESMCDGIVEKPFDSQTFLAKIDELKAVALVATSAVPPPAAKSAAVPVSPPKSAPAPVPPISTPPTPKPAPAPEEPDFSFDFEMTETPAAPPAPVAAAKPAAAAPAPAPAIDELEDLLDIEDIESIEEIDEAELESGAVPAFGQDEEVREETAAVEEITLDDLLEGEPAKKTTAQPEPSIERSMNLDSISEENIISQAEIEPAASKPDYQQEAKINIDDIFADLSDILKEDTPKKEKERKEDLWSAPVREVVAEPASVEEAVVEEVFEPVAPPPPPPVDVKPVVEQVAKQLREFETVGVQKQEQAEEADIWDFDLDEEPKPAPAVSAPATPARAAAPVSAGSVDRGEIENIIRDVTYELVEKIAWEVVPEIIETILKDKGLKK